MYFLWSRRYRSRLLPPIMHLSFGFAGDDRAVIAWFYRIIRLWRRRRGHTFIRLENTYCFCLIVLTVARQKGCKPIKHARWSFSTADSSRSLGPDPSASCVGLIREPEPAVFSSVSTERHHRGHLRGHSDQDEAFSQVKKRRVRLRCCIDAGRASFTFLFFIQMWRNSSWITPSSSSSSSKASPPVSSSICCNDLFIQNTVVDRVFPVLPLKLSSPSIMILCVASKWLLWCELVWVGRLERRPLNHGAHVKPSALLCCFY